MSWRGINNTVDLFPFISWIGLNNRSENIAHSSFFDLYANQLTCLSADPRRDEFQSNWHADVLANLATTRDIRASANSNETTFQSNIPFADWPLV